jgi:hypothetical protein
VEDQNVTRIKEIKKLLELTSKEFKDQNNLESKYRPVRFVKSSFEKKHLHSLKQSSNKDLLNKFYHKEELRNLLFFLADIIEMT